MTGKTTFSDGQLRSIVERILRLKQEQDELASDIRGIYTEAKSHGFDKTALGQVVTHLRRRERLGEAEADQREAMFDLYLSAYESGEPHARAREEAA